MILLTIVIVLTIAIFIWFIRLTRPDHRKSRTAHRSDQDATLFV